MGLDMYLCKHIFVGANYEHRNVTGVIDISADGRRIPIDFKRVSCIVEQVGYWRKANQIHRWFVENVQDGEDDGREYYVSREKLLELKRICQKILAEQNEGKRIALAKSLLPTQEGFFFGSQKYDEDYFCDLEDTVKIIDFLNLDSEQNEVEESCMDYRYRASW